MTGVDDPYERPTRPELVIDTGRVDLAAGVDQAGSLLLAITEKER
jgi:adenylylsulfate kinase-like enzyme